MKVYPRGLRREVLERGNYTCCKCGRHASCILPLETTVVFSANPAVFMALCSGCSTAVRRQRHQKEQQLGFKW